MNYYDLVLVLIPLTLFSLTGALVVGGVTLSVAVPVAAATSALMIGHALFFRGPVDVVVPRVQA